MGLLSFIKEAGEKLFGGSSAQAAEPDANDKAAAAIKTYIETQNLGLTNLVVTYVASTGIVTLAGNAPSQEASEKASLAAGNVANVTSVENNLVAPPHHPRSTTTWSRATRCRPSPRSTTATPTSTTRSSRPTSRCCRIRTRSIRGRSCGFRR